MYYVFNSIFLLCAISVSKLLILTGAPGFESKKIEVVDLQNPLNSCSLPEEFPMRLYGATGGLTKSGPLLLFAAVSTPIPILRQMPSLPYIILNSSKRM